jgi:hypothetical protein
LFLHPELDKSLLLPEMQHLLDLAAHHYPGGIEEPVMIHWWDKMLARLVLKLMCR